MQWVCVRYVFRPLYEFVSIYDNSPSVCPFSLFDLRFIISFVFVIVRSYVLRMYECGERKHKPTNLFQLKRNIAAPGVIKIMVILYKTQWLLNLRSSSWQIISRFVYSYMECIAGPGSTSQKCNDKQCLGTNRHPKKCTHFFVQHFIFPFELHAHGTSKSIGYGVQFIRCLIK